MNIIEYLEAKYGEQGTKIVTAMEAKAFGIKWPLQSGWLVEHGSTVITREMAHSVALKLYEKGMRSGSESKANYCLAGASLLREICEGKHAERAE